MEQQNSGFGLFARLLVRRVLVVGRRVVVNAGLRGEGVSKFLPRAARRTARQCAIAVVSHAIRCSRREARNIISQLRYSLAG